VIQKQVLINDGLDYSVADDICYYRIEATVTGDSNPTIKWSNDGSQGSL